MAPTHLPIQFIPRAGFLEPHMHLHGFRDIGSALLTIPVPVPSN